MKNEKYENMIDRFIELIKIVFWYIITFISIYLLPAIIIITLNNKFDYTIQFWWSLLIVSIISFPITIFIFYYNKSIRLYDIKRYRDFWMGFSTFVELKRGNNEDEIKKWILENTHHMYKIVYENKYYFMSKVDAMAFKLRWIG